MTPTAIPSGILCIVTANTSIVDFFNWLSRPSISLSKCICGMFRSNNNKNIIPSKKPTVAGTKANFPMSSDISIAGINNDQTEAATITPDAKPNNIF